LADLVETYFARIRSLEAALEDAHANAESLRNGWLNARSRVAEAERLRSQRRRREARAILVALAAPLELPALPNTIGRLADPDEAFAANG
ncbi:hypothetical protein, partial [Mesorhizobium sp.]|uniref:hypothetical protein n=1 Tax=Mesorhizobium sp. TaxID=1871066 RepID=UPI0025EB4095